MTDDLVRRLREVATLCAPCGERYFTYEAVAQALERLDDVIVRDRYRARPKTLSECPVLRADLRNTFLAALAAPNQEDK